MARNRCPHCARKMPYAGRRCVHCGWSVLRQQGLDEGKGVAWWRRRGLWSVMVAGLVLKACPYEASRSHAMSKLSPRLLISSREKHRNRPASPRSCRAEPPSGSSPYAASNAAPPIRRRWWNRR